MISFMAYDRMLPMRLTVFTQWAANGERRHASDDGYECLGMHGVFFQGLIWENLDTDVFALEGLC